MRAAGVGRFVGISGAGMDMPGDTKSRRDRVISVLMQRLGGSMVADKAGEYAVWAAGGLELGPWCGRPRLSDAAPTGRVEHDAHASPRGTAIGRADLAAFLVDCVDQGLDVGQAPLVAAV